MSRVINNDSIRNAGNLKSKLGNMCIMRKYTNVMLMAAEPASVTVAEYTKLPTCAIAL